MMLELLSYFKKNKDKLSNKQKFLSVIRAANELAESNPRNLYSLIKILGRNIQYKYFSEFIKCAGIEGLEEHTSRVLIQPRLETLWIDRHDRSVPFELREWILNEVKNDNGEKTIEVDLTRDIVLPWPWNFYRFKDSFINIGAEKKWGPWEQDESNHMLMCWEPIGVCFVGGGNHSLMTGIINQEGTVKSDIINEMEEMYKLVSCDGENYYFHFKNEIKLASKVLNLDFALIYEIGRILHQKGIRYWPIDK